MSKDMSSTWEWQPGKIVVAVWNVLALVLVVIGLIGFSSLYASARDTAASVEVAGAEALVALVVTVLLIALLMVLHEWVHGRAMKAFGGEPQYGAGMMHRIVPYFSCTAPGHRFTKWQFLVIGLAPCIVLTVPCLLAIAFLPMGGWLIIPAAVHLGGCIGDFWMSGKVLAQGGDLLFEDCTTGIRFHRT